MGRVSRGRRRRAEPGPDEDPLPELDLHGLPPERALERLRLFLHASRVGGAREVLAITGAGHSNATGRPVLRERVETWLRGDEGRKLGVAHVERTAKGGALAIRFDSKSERP